ncbi:MAG: hypothetical protein WHT28_00800 [Fimbriimonadales bacterium]
MEKAILVKVAAALEIEPQEEAEQEMEMVARKLEKEDHANLASA